MYVRVAVTAASLTRMNQWALFLRGLERIGLTRVVIGDFVGLECEESFDAGSPYVMYMHMLMIYETKYM
jgi:hypothetical protein